MWDFLPEWRAKYTISILETWAPPAIPQTLHSLHPSEPQGTGPMLHRVSNWVSFPKHRVYLYWFLVETTPVSYWAILSPFGTFWCPTTKLRKSETQLFSEWKVPYCIRKKKPFLFISAVSPCCLCPVQKIEYTLHLVAVDLKSSRFWDGKDHLLCHLANLTHCRCDCLRSHKHHSLATSRLIWQTCLFI